ncbi:MAG: hypothetical protein P8O91_08060 [Luminiphilus sp.]|nr:hypothetical protein [Luminiphilus sp.]
MKNSPLTAAELQALYGEPRKLVAEAWATGLEATRRTFIAASR